jgi:hypothetical protein
MAGISDQLAGADLKQVWKPDPRATNVTGSGDAYAPFALMTRGLTSELARGVAQFVRVGTAGIAAGGACGVTNGVTVTAGAGNNWVNDTPVAVVQGDYLFVTSAGVTA